MVSDPTADNSMKQVDTEPVERNGVVSGGADATERDMEDVKGKTDKGKNKAHAPREAKKADEGESKEDAKDAKDDGPDVSNNNIRDKGGGDGWDEIGPKREMNKEMNN